MWEGSRTSFETAASVFGADEVLPIEELPSTLKKLSSHYDHIYTDGANKRGRSKSLLRLFSNSTSESIVDTLPSAKRKSLAAEVGKMRAIKSEAEQRIMGQAAQISGRAHTKVSLARRNVTCLLKRSTDDALHRAGDARIRSRISFRVPMRIEWVPTTRLCACCCIWARHDQFRFRCRHY